jgi:2-octaprenyl-6-methoxyphenol hydroxylase
MTDLRYDAIILGGGFSGLTMAVALAGPAARSPMRVALIDERPTDVPLPAEGDGRAFAITSTSRQMLAALGVWNELAPHAQAVNRIEVLDSPLDAHDRPVLLNFDREGVETSASIIESRFLLQAFDAAASASPHITRLQGARAIDIDGDGPSASILLEDGRELHCSLAIAADGRNSPTRDMVGIRTIGWSYRQYGMVTTVSHELPHTGVAVEHFLPAGPFAILPLPGNQSSLVWTETEEEAQRMQALDDADFTAELRRRFGDRLGEVTLAGPRRSYPLSLMLAQNYIAPRVALVGDAAHVLHPIAGLGFNVGLRDIAALGETMLDAARLGLDIGSPTVLERYQAWRRFDALKVGLVTDALNRLFSNDNPLLRQLRDFGLTAVDRAGPLKSFFMSQAAGEDHGLPRLMTGSPL